MRTKLHEKDDRPWLDVTKRTPGELAHTPNGD